MEEKNDQKTKSFVLDQKKEKKIVAEASDLDKIEFFYVAPKKFVILTILTNGLYFIYWFYKNWKAVSSAINRKGIVFWRTVFAPWFSFGLFKIIIIQANKHGYNSKKSGYYYAWLFLIIGGLFSGVSSLFEDAVKNGQISINTLNSFIPLTLYVLGFLYLLPLIEVQKAINFNNEKINPNIGNKKSYSGGEKAVVVIFGIMTLLSVLGLIFTFLAPFFGWDY
ncbi:MAG: hypothetical protein WCK37_03305 [Candidatus Falkowbacteria bacterium]